MSYVVGLLLLLVTASVDAQLIPQFEPLFSSNTVSIGINERPQTGDLVIATMARGLGGETVVYGVDLPSNAQGVFEMNPQTGRLTVGPNGPSRLVITDKTPVVILAEVFAYYNSSGPAQANRAYLLVNVEVLDINDPPDFGSATLEIGTSVSTGVGQTIMRLEAVDHDLSSNGVVQYSMQQVSPDGQNVFILQRFTGDLVLARSLDLQTTYQLRVTATDFGEPPLSSSVIITVLVAPIAPTFTQSVYTAELQEFTSQTPVTVTTVEATDGDPMQSETTIVYSIETIIPMAPDVTFSIGQSDGVVTINGTVDRETHSLYFVQVLAHESGFETVSVGAGTATVLVNISDINEPPEFLSSHYTTVVSEGAEVGSILTNTIRAVDYDQGSNSALVYNISSLTGLLTQNGTRVTITQPFFLIDSVTAVLTVNTDLEREAVFDGYHYYEMIITVADSGDTPLTDTTILTITVVDINDNPPVFANPLLNFTTPENRGAGTPIGEFLVSDRDQGSSAEMIFSLQGAFADRFFVSVASVMYSPSLEAQPPVITQGRILNRVPLDREEVDSYQFTLMAMDRSLAPLSATIPLTITVSEINDNAPTFTNPNFTFVIPENYTIGSVISDFMVTDRDLGDNALVGFSLSSDAEGLFSLSTVQPSVADLILSHALDRETTPTYTFRIFATDRGVPPLIGETDITIIVGDVNDNPPVFTSQLYDISLIENTPPGLRLITVTATDPDEGVNAEFTFSSIDPLVQVNEVIGEVTLASPLDYEMGGVVDIQILAIDRGEPPLTGITTLRITLIDVNDNAPMFERARYNESVLEGLTPGSQFAQITAMDADSEIFGQITYNIISQPSEGLFAINPNTGHLTVERVLDRESNDVPSYTIIVGAADGGNPPLSAQAIVDIEVGDVNDNAPMFLNEPYSAIVDEGTNRSVGVLVLDIDATDADIGTNSQIRFSLAGQFAEFFTINPSSGIIRVSDIGVDFEALPPGNPLITIDIIASDLGTSPRIATSTIEITILDGNDNVPQFIGVPYVFSIPESISANRSLVITVNATDLDAGSAGQVQYQLARGEDAFFEIDENTGDVYLLAGVTFDREAPNVPHNDNGDAVYSFGVVAADLGDPVQISLVTVSVLVTDLNDNSPVFPESTISRSIVESLSVNTNVLNLVAIDNDFGINARVNYTIVSETTTDGTIMEDFTFSVDADTGMLSLTKTLDREVVPMITLVVMATDQGMGNNQNSVTIFFNVTDVNDNSPIFITPPGGYIAMVPEDSGVGSEVIRVNATDRDQGIHQTITYSILSNTTGAPVPFEIRDPASGVISVSGALDRELVSEYQLFVVATDSADNAANIQQTFAVVRVILLDINDSPPVFGAAAYRGSVRENSRRGTIVEMVPPLIVTDPDTTPFNFSLHGNHTQLFTINQFSGVITTNSPFDFELQQTYTELTIRASDGVQNATASLIIDILDDNDNAPQFDSDTIMVSVSEDTDPGTQIFVVRANDTDSGQNGLIMYSLEREDTEQLFSIGPLTGVITLMGDLDFELQQMYMLTVLGADSGEISLNGTLDLIIQVLDVNDNPPVISNPLAEFSIIEDAPPGSIVGIVMATDGDSIANGDLRYDIVNGNEAGVFQINETSGIVVVNNTLDREVQDRYRLLIQVMDSSAFPLTNETFITVSLEDTNDNAPVFLEPNAQVEISESSGINFEAYVVVARDADIGNNSAVQYFIDDQQPESHFTIDRETGTINVIAPLDRETIPEYILTITVRDQGNPSLNTTDMFRIVLLDENDNTPMFTSNSYSVAIPEGQYANTTTLLLASATDTDIGSNGLVNYSIISVLANGAAIPLEDSPFDIDPTFGAVFIVGELDRETFGMYSVQLQAVDLGNPPRDSQALLSIAVTDINDNAPVFENTRTNFTIAEDAMMNTIIAVIRTTDRDQGVNADTEYRFTDLITEGLFSIDASGSVVVSGDLDFESVQNPIMLTVEAVNNESEVPLFSTLQLFVEVLDVNDNPPVFPSGIERVYEVSESAIIGSQVAMLPVIDADSNENALITFQVFNQDGSIPFRFGSNGNLIVSGDLDRETTPRYTVIVEASDGGSPSLSAQLTLTINILDENDNLPEFEGSPLFTIQESQAPGTVFGRLDTTDRDIDHVAFYYIIGGDDTDIVRIEDPQKGELSLITNVDFEAGQTVLSVIVAAVNTNSAPSASCTPGATCNTITVTIIVEDSNDNQPVFPETDFGVNQSAPVNTIIGQLMASDVDTRDFGTVNFEFTVPQSLFSLDAEDGTLRLAQTFNASVDNKYNEIPIRAFDNPTNRLQSLATTSTARIYFVEESELVILVLSNTLAEVQRDLSGLQTGLANTGSEIGVFILDILEYTTTLDLSTPPPPFIPQKRQLIQTNKVNITMFAVNRTAQGILTSNDFISQLTSTIEAVIGSYPQINIDSLLAHPLPPTSSDPLSRETILLILYIVAGALGALIIFIIIAAFVIFCTLRFTRGKKRSYMPGRQQKRDRPISNVSTDSERRSAHSNPTYINPYSRWSDDADLELGVVEYREVSVDGPDRRINRQSKDSVDFRESVLYESQDFVMANFVEEGGAETDNDEEDLVEDTQSLSEQSTGDSTSERDRGDRQPLVRGGAWEEGGLRSSAAELELTAEDDDDEYSEEDEESKEYTEEGEGSEEEGSEEGVEDDDHYDEDPEEEGSTEEGSEDEDEEDYDDDDGYDYEDNPDGGFKIPEPDTNEFPLMF